MPGPAPTFSPVFAEDFRQQARCVIRLRLALYEEHSNQYPMPMQAIFKMLMLAEGRFRRLNAPERMKQVFLGVQFRDGIEFKQE